MSEQRKLVDYEYVEPSDSRTPLHHIRYGPIEEWRTEEGQLIYRKVSTESLEHTLIIGFPDPQLTDITDSKKIPRIFRIWRPTAEERAWLDELFFQTFHRRVVFF